MPNKNALPLQRDEWYQLKAYFGNQQSEFYSEPSMPNYKNTLTILCHCQSCYKCKALGAYMVFKWALFIK